jgi:hypothetical protein
MTEAGSQAPDHGCLRASDADREQAIASLKAAFVRGRLDKNEFDLRIGLALAAQARADLAAVTADIPAEVAGTSLPPERARLRRDPPAKTGAAVVVVAVDAGAFAAAVSLPATLIVVFLVMLALGITGTALVAALIRGMLLIEARHARRPDGQMPPPGAAGSRSRRMLPARGIRPKPRQAAIPGRDCSARRWRSLGCCRQFGSVGAEQVMEPEPARLMFLGQVRSGQLIQRHVHLRGRHRGQVGCRHY